MAQRSPRKPRILWRGELHLPDGTALPGLAIVSTTQPQFAIAACQADSAGGDDAADVFTLSKEQQDELTLAIEMVRHAPLRIIDVQTDACLDGQGRLCSSSSASSTCSSAVGRAQSAVATTYEAAGDVRLYVDPAERSTVAFFERTFAYEAYGARTDEAHAAENEAGGGDAGISLARSAITFSFDKAPTYDADTKDVFASALAFWSPQSTSDGAAYGRSSSDGATEAAIVGVVRRSDGGRFEHVELHVGRKVCRRNPNSAASQMPAAQPGRTAPNSSVRPDDPAPRLAGKFALPRKLPFAASRSTPAVLQGRRPSDAGARSTATGRQPDGVALVGDASPLFPSTSVVNTTKKRGGAHTPGRRGEKRSKTVTAEDGIQASKPSVKSEPNGGMAPSATQRESNGGGGVEDQNRSLIKKLVHYQLLGKGVERHEEAYVACFGFTCQGALLAFRKMVKLEPIDKHAAAAVIERHLDMYL